LIIELRDAFLKKVFVERNNENKHLPLASEVIRKYKKYIINSVSQFSHEKKYIVYDILRTMQKRIRQLPLVVPDDEAVVTVYLTSYVTSLIMHYQYTGRFRGVGKERKT